MNAATQNPTVVRGSAPKTASYSTLFERCRDLCERMYVHMKRQPDSIYEERKGRAVPFLLKHVTDYRREVSKGASPRVLLEAHETVGLELEAMCIDQPSSIPGRAFLSSQEAHEIEFADECHANVLQLRARERRDLQTLRDARTASVSERATLTQYIRALDREIAAKERLAS